MAKTTRLAAGFILASRQAGETIFLLLKNARHGAWGFPKGHAEGSETALQAALRETLEETGISKLDVVEGFEWHDEYETVHPRRGKYRKQVVYFLARIDKPEHKQSEEHSDSAWLPLEHALKRLQFEALRNALKAAAAKLSAKA